MEKPGQLDQERSDQVCEHQIEGALAGRQAAPPNSNAIRQRARQTVEAGIRRGGLHGDRVRVHSQQLARAQLGRCYRQDPGSAADVDDPSGAVGRGATPQEPLIGECLEGGQA